MATLDAARRTGRRSLYLGHVDTVLADPSEWRHDPWSGDVADGYLWGRGALDMKSQVAAEAVAGATLARDGWRPARGTLKLVFVADEETGGECRRALADAATTRTRSAATCCSTRAAASMFEFGGAAPLRRVLRREGHLPLQADRPRRGRARLAAADRRQRAAEARPGAPEARRRAQPSYRRDRGPRRRCCAGSGEDPADPAGRRGADRPGRPGAADAPRADARRDADADDGPRLGQDQRDPVAARR